MEITLLDELAKIRNLEGDQSYMDCITGDDYKKIQRQGLPAIKKAASKLKTPEQIVSFLRFIHFLISDNEITFLNSVDTLTHIKKVYLNNGIKKYGMFYPSNKKREATFILWEDSDTTEEFAEKLFDVLYDETK